jgi:hypothetical protein
MDCDLARRLLPFDRPGAADLEPADRAALNRHVDTCPACAAVAANDHAFDAGLTRAMFAVAVPDTLHSRLTTKLAAARMAIYRRMAIRGLLGVCALLLCVSIWSNWRRPMLDPAALATQAYQQSGLSRSNEEARDLATAWLRQIDSDLEAPDDLNYRLFAFPCRSELQGLTGVPTLVFAHGEGIQRVYAIRERAFKDLAEFREPVQDGGCTVEARRYQSLPGWVFVVVTSGAVPDEFKRPHLPTGPA